MFLLLNKNFVKTNKVDDGDLLSCCVTHLQQYERVQNFASFFFNNVALNWQY